ncbi:MAG: phosphoribosyl-ATP diphosphatase [Rhodospirillaceae bacterium]|nr:phosphoribosyl-ATP diphosphatase [Rhodospirillaceae bacterium]|tara:strand:- start:734 stop:1069 length:336 start_codon:yes stop_codon:yes gene_type:complete
MVDAKIDIEVLERLYTVIQSRKDGDADSSYTASLLKAGMPKMAQKLGEEAVETVIAATEGDSQQLVGESADLLYHLLVVWAASGITPDDVWAELAGREGISGIEEKAARES